MREDHNPGAIQDYLKELSTATRKVERFFLNKPLNSVDLNRVIEYASAVEEIHKRLQEGYAPANGSSRIIEQFFNEWNNLVFGVFYTADLVEMNKSLTVNQYDIFITTLRGIREYIDNFGAVRK